MEDIPCPQCGALMVYVGRGRFECENDSCSIIQVKRQSFNGKLTQFKRSTVNEIPKDKEMIGQCKACGKRHVRPSPCNVAVCKANGIHDKHVEVPLRPQHLTVRWDLQTEVKV